MERVSPHDRTLVLTDWAGPDRQVSKADRGSWLDALERQSCLPSWA